jgi:hypothetical protein
LHAIITKIAKGSAIKDTTKAVAEKTAAKNTLIGKQTIANKEVANYRTQIETLINQGIPAESDQVNAIKQKLGPAQLEVENLTKQIADLTSVITSLQQSGTTTNNEPAVINFLKALYTRGDKMRRDYIETLEDPEETLANKLIIYNNKIQPLHVKAAIIQDYIGELDKTFKDTDVLDKMYAEFSKLNSNIGRIPVPKDTTNVVEGIKVSAVSIFNRLLQEEAENPIDVESDDEDGSWTPEEEAAWEKYKASQAQLPEEPSYRTVKDMQDGLDAISKQIEVLKQEQKSPEQEKQLNKLTKDYNDLHADIVKEKSKHDIETRPYMISMAQYLAAEGKTADTFTVISEDGMEKFVVVPEAIQAAVISYMGKGKDFSLLRGAVNSPLYMRITVTIPRVGKLSEHLHITDFYSMKKFASLDKSYILNHMNVDEPEEE